MRSELISIVVPPFVVCQNCLVSCQRLIAVRRRLLERRNAELDEIHRFYSNASRGSIILIHTGYNSNSSSLNYYREFN